jgi:hypothetical protein
VDLGTEPPPKRAVRRPDFVARDTLHALQIIMAVEGLNRWPADLSPATTGSPLAPADLTYHPPHWPPSSTTDAVDRAELPTASATGPGGPGCRAAAASGCLLPTGGSHGHGG